MGVLIPVIVMSLFWGVIGFVAPWLVPKGPNKWVIQVMLMMTAVCCYLFWAITTLAQINPLIGPTLENTTIYIMQELWKS